MHQLPGRIILFLAFLPFTSRSQAGQGKEWLLLDSLVIHHLDTNVWSWQASDSIVTLRLKDSVLTVSAINSPELDEYSELDFCSRFSKNEKQQYVMRICFGQRWSREKKEKAARWNDSINRLISRLPGKYRVKKLDTPMHMYEAHNSRQRERLKNYLSELHRLSGQLLSLPDLESGSFSIFMDEHSCYTPNEQHPDWKGYFLVPMQSERERSALWELLEGYKRSLARK